MKIRTKLYLSTIIAIAFIVVLFIMISKATHNISQAQQRVENTQNLVWHTTSMVILLDESITFGYERTKQSLTQVLTKLHSTAGKLPAEDANFIVGKLEEVEQMIKRLNLEMVRRDPVNAITNQLISQIRLVAHSVLSRAFTLSRQAHKNIEKTNQNNFSTAMHLTLSQIVFMLISSFLIIRGITRPLNSLIDDAGKIERRSKDELTYLGPGSKPNPQTEIGKLAQAFNRMTMQLDDTIRSLQSNRQQLHLALKSAKCGLWDWDISDDRVRFDDNYYLISDYRNGDFPEYFSEWEEKIHPDDLGQAKTAIKQYLSGESERYSSEFRVKRKDNSWMWILSSGEIIEKTSDGTPIRMIGLHVDINERKKVEIERLELESQLHQKVKMEAIGTMAGGIAHNFNNNLAIILGNLELSLKKGPRDSKIIANLMNAQKATLRSRDLITQILSYSRKDVQNAKVPLHLAALIEETYKMLKSTIPSSVNLHRIIDKESFNVYISAEASRIQEILLNLCNNSVHAMQDVGDLTIRLRVARIQKEDIPPNCDCTPGRYANLRVTDTGCGIPNEAQVKIFDPFYTTKEVNEGTGLGLSTVKGIVEQHEGFIRVISSPGKGTTFALYFPLVDTPSIRELSLDTEVPRGHGRILLIDDEDMLVQLGTQILTDSGYDVTAMTSSAEALRLFEKNPRSFDLIITDQTMPSLSGKDLIKKILAIRPDIPTILTTGYSHSISEEEAKEIGIKAFCLKPMDMTETIQTVHRVLSEFES